MSLNQIELVWVRVRMEWECFWVNLREDNKVSESKMAVSESNMAEFKIAAIIRLSQNEWSEVFLCKIAESKMAEFKMDAIINLRENTWVKFFSKCKWLNPRWQNSRWLPSSSWVRMNEFESDWISLSQSFVQNGRIQDGRIANMVPYQRMTLSQKCWVRVRWRESDLSESERR